MSAGSVAYLGLDIGGTKIAGGLVQFEPQPQVAAQASVPTDPARGAGAVLNSVVDLAQKLLGQSATPVVAIGVGAAGVVDPLTGEIVSATDLIPGWAGTALADELRAATGLPVAVVGDVVAHGLGEHLFGAAKGAASSLTVGIGTGIGGAFVEGGRPLTGARGLAGHVGHVTSPLAEGQRCSCGREGHVEPIASGTGIANQYNREAGTTLTGREVDDLAESGDELAVSIVRNGGFALGQVLASLANTLDPEVIVLSGSVTNSGQTWWRAVKSGFHDQAMDLVQDAPLYRGTLGGDAPLIGAASVAAQLVASEEGEGANG